MRRKLNPELATQIRTEYKSGSGSMVSLAEKYNVSFSTIQAILSNRLYHDTEYSYECKNRKPNQGSLFYDRATNKYLARLRGKHIGRFSRKEEAERAITIRKLKEIVS